MQQTAEQRLERLERLVSNLDGRVAAMETGVASELDVERPIHAPPALTEWPARAATRFDLGRDDFEDLVGGRVLAWVGGLTVLLGIAFLFALAVSNGWIGETARVLLGGAGSAGLLALGVWLHERKARTDAALASAATGIAGLFVTVTVAAQVYEILPQLPAVALLIGVGALATGLAAAWESRGIAALGILGGIAAPLLAGAPSEGGTMLILFVALAAAAAVLLRQRWDWLALAAFAVATPQWGGFVLGGAESSLEELAALIGFGALGVAVAVGHDIRIKAERLRASSAYLFTLNAIAISVVGWAALRPGTLWLAGVAAVHLGVGLLGRHVGITNDLRLLALTIGVLLADVVFAFVASGPVQAIGWAASGVGFAMLLRRTSASDARDPGSAALVHVGLGGHLALSLLSAIAVSDPTEVLAGSDALSSAGAAAVAALAAGCLVSARIADERNELWKIVLDGAGLVCVAVLTAMTLDGLQLVLAWVAEGVTLAAIARRVDEPVAPPAAVGFLSLAAVHAIAVEAPPVSLVTGLADPLAAVAALAAVTAGGVVLGAWAADDDPQGATALRAAAALVLLYLGSAVVVTPFESDAAVDSTLLSAHQQGQMVLSVFWGLVGVGTIVVGLRRDLAPIRIAGLALVGMTVSKLFLFDLASLTAGYRVAAFIGLGLLLLGVALVWQRLRPRALEDLRETPAGVR